MDGRGGACITRYTGGGAHGGFREITYGMSKVERIMLKFRPIAPKPISAGSGSSSCSTAELSGGGNRRRKRRYVRANGKNKLKDSTDNVSKKPRVSSSSENSGGGEAAVTLSLMPETPDRKENLDLINYSVSTTNRNKLSSSSPILLSFNNYQQPTCDGHVRSVGTDRTVVTSLVTLECVTDTWTMNRDDLGFTDQVRVRNMEVDTCPSFITDDRDAVVWTNKAYRKMTAGAAGGGGLDETVLAVVKKLNLVTMPVSDPVFTCKVKVTWGSERGVSSSPVSITAPCDVWRLRSGGYAWRLDVKAALSLGPALLTCN